MSNSFSYTLHSWMESSAISAEVFGLYWFILIFCLLVQFVTPVLSITLFYGLNNTVSNTFCEIKVMIWCLQLVILRNHLIFKKSSSCQLTAISCHMAGFCCVFYTINSTCFNYPVSHIKKVMKSTGHKSDMDMFYQKEEWKENLECLNYGFYSHVKILLAFFFQKCHLFKCTFLSCYMFTYYSIFMVNMFKYDLFIM